MNPPMNLAREFELEPGETVLAEMRKHWFIFTLELLPYAVIAFLPLLLPAVFSTIPQAAPYLLALSATSAAGRLAYGVWLLVVWTAGWGAFTRYYLNVWVLTDRRIVEVAQHGWFDREVSSMLLNRVQDVTTEVAGLIPSMLHIGNISVQSAGTLDEFHMNGIANPEQLRDLILARTGRGSADQGV